MAYYNIGSAFQIQQNHEEACKYFRKAVELDNEDEGFNIALAMSMVKIGQYKEAAEIYKSLLIMHPEKENYKFNLISCYEAMGEIQTAISMLEKIVYIADYIEPARNKAPRLTEIRRLAFEDLDECMYEILKDTLEYLEEDSAEDIEPTSREAYIYYKELHNKRSNVTNS